MGEKKALNLTNDYVFKRIFGKEGNEDITKDFLQAILKEDINEIKLNENPILEKNIQDDKMGILDIKARINNNILCDIEVQVARENDIIKRILFYWSKLYISDIKEGEEYNKLHKTIVILITNFEIKELEEIPKYHTRWEIREEEYSKIILTNALEIDILELPKLLKESKKQGFKENDLEQWLRTIINPEEVRKDRKVVNPMIVKSIEELDEFQKKEHEVYLAELRDKYVRDMNSMKATGYEDGLEAGIKEGQAIGAKEEKRQIVINMYKKKIDINVICEVTNLSKEEVNEIINSQEERK